MDKYMSPCYGEHGSTLKTIQNSPNDSGYLSSSGDFGSGSILRYLRENRDTPGCNILSKNCCRCITTPSNALAEERDDSHGWHVVIQSSPRKLLAASCNKDETLISELNTISSPHGKLQFSPPDAKTISEQHSSASSETQFSNVWECTNYPCNSVVSEILPTEVHSEKDPMYVSGIISKGSSLRFGSLNQTRVDILGALANYRPVVSRILQFLRPEDLVSVATVSHKWRNICKSDNKANHRRQMYLQIKMQFKENEDKSSPYIQAQQHSRKYLRRGACSELQNLRVPSPRKKELVSPPVSPSKVRFHLFYKEGGKLSQGEYLMPCPRCSLPSHTSSSDGYGRCSRPGCLFEFCIQCRCAVHKGTPCRISLPTLQNHCKRTHNVIGSASSRKNLRKLLL